MAGSFLTGIVQAQFGQGLVFALVLVLHQFPFEVEVVGREDRGFLCDGGEVQGYYGE
ncbi:MAG: hypothetical protein IPN33_03185 [Saprospiraceae bacterium]|nr:hypothetical protein [Saprospiraceae bacterium]